MSPLDTMSPWEFFALGIVSALILVGIAAAIRDEYRRATARVTAIRTGSWVAECLECRWRYTGQSPFDAQEWAYEHQRRAHGAR